MDRDVYQEASERNWCLKASYRKSKTLPAGMNVKALLAGESA